MIPIVWKISKKRASRALQTFSATEADSGWQFLYALDGLEDPKLRAEMFNNSLEEMYHSSEFDKMSHLCSDRMPTKPKPEREPLYDSSKPLADFLAYVYVGEKDVYDQFDAYSAAVKKAALSQGLQHTVFDEAKEDETNHLELAKEALINEYGSMSLVKKKVTWIRLKRAYQSWLRFSKRLGEFSSGIILSVLYFISGLFLASPSRKKFQSDFRGVTANTQVETGALALENPSPEPR
jgi:hypothetical protein